MTISDNALDAMARNSVSMDEVVTLLSDKSTQVTPTVPGGFNFIYSGQVGSKPLHVLVRKGSTHNQIISVWK